MTLDTRYRRFRERLRALNAAPIVRSTLFRTALVGSALAAGATAFAAGGPWAVVAAGMGSAVALTIALSVSDERDVGVIVPLVAGLLVLRVAATSLLDVILQARSEGGAMFQDDLGYVTLGSLIARIWHGEQAQFPKDQSVVSTYVILVGGLFWLIGPNVAALKILNTTLAIVAALFIYRISLLIWERNAARWGLGAMLLFPSIDLWSSLALKESFALVCATGMALAVTEHLSRPRVAWLVAAPLFALPLQDTRPYLFTLLAVTWPVALLISRIVRGRPRLTSVAGAAAASFILLSGVRPGMGLSPTAITDLESLRGNMAERARSAIVEPTRTVQGSDGECFVIEVPGSAAAAAEKPRTLYVPVGTVFVFANRDTPDAAPPKGSVHVQTGDIACVAGGGRTAAPSPTASPVIVAIPISPTPAPTPRLKASVGSNASPASQPTPPLAEVKVTPTPAPTSPRPAESASVTATQSSPPIRSPMMAALEVSPTGSTRIGNGGEVLPTDTREDVVRNLAYLPRGLAYLIAAPFPWDAISPGRLALWPELAFWYSTVALAGFGCARFLRRRLLDGSFVLIMGVLLTVVISLVEGNLGTLVRHRAMLIPFAVVIASPGADHVASLLGPRIATRLRRSIEPALRALGSADR